MERFLQQYSKDYVKTAMLQHEETFRKQVSELHRLYQVQKLLMGDMKRKTGLAVDRRSVHCAPDPEHLAGEHGGIGDKHPDARRVHKGSEVELTLSLGTTKGKEVLDVSSTSFSSSSTDSSGVHSRLRNWGPFQVPDMNLNFTANDGDFAAEDAIVWDGKQETSWQFHCLGLKTA